MTPLQKVKKQLEEEKTRNSGHVVMIARLREDNEDFFKTLQDQRQAVNDASDKVDLIASDNTKLRNIIEDSHLALIRMSRNLRD